MKKNEQEIVIDVFKAGDYPQGKFGLTELSEIQASYNPENYEAPIIIGHLTDPSYQGKSAIPAYGWIGQIKVVGDHLKVVASQFSDELKNFVKEGFYKKVSAAFWKPTDKTNPTPGKWHLHHLAFLGGVPPTIKGLEQIAFAEMSSAGVEFAEIEADIDEKLIEEVEKIGADDTLKDISESCANFLAKAESALKSDVDKETRRSRMHLAVSDLMSEINGCLLLHNDFEDKLENIEEHAEMSEKGSWLVRVSTRVQSILQGRKDKEMDAVKQKEFEDKIVGLESQLKEFADKEQLAADAKAQAEQAVKDAEIKAAQDALDSGVKEFCEATIKEGRMTPAMRAVDEPIMLKLAKTDADALVSFQQKYTVQAVPLGIVKEVDVPSPNDNRSQVIQNAEKYVKAHPTEFADLTAADAINRAFYLHSMGKIKFENKH
jgi:hypothetical protein